MDFSWPDHITEDINRFNHFLRDEMEPYLANWYREGEVPKQFFKSMGTGGWFNFTFEDNKLKRLSSFRGSLMAERLAALSPGVAVALMVHSDLGLTGLQLFGSDDQISRCGKSALNGDLLLCLGNTEAAAGSDVSGIGMTAEKVHGGWRLNGTKAYVTGGSAADVAFVTAITDPSAERNRKLSMFLVDLSSEGVTRKKLNKQVWIPSDLSRIQLKNVFVPEDHLVGELGQGLQQVLSIFTHSRVPISALTLGTAQGAFEMAMAHASKRRAFDRRLLDFQNKAFEAADFYAKIESARLLLWKACWKVDSGEDFRLAASLAKFMTVSVAKEVTGWAADIFGAASVIADHPIHNFPLDAWASSLGEGTQDIQKLIIFREMIKKLGIPDTRY
jgi:alkylation response protein AidB-like acyl-CoA dehydrogenase